MPLKVLKGPWKVTPLSNSIMDESGLIISTTTDLIVISSDISRTSSFNLRPNFEIAGETSIVKIKQIRNSKITSL
jgi:hypothetical protein